MCFFTQQTKKAQELEHRFHAKFTDVDTYKTGVYNGFEHPNTPVITNQNQSSIQLFQWGLIPGWAKSTDIQRYTLNAKLETMHEKMAFKDSMNNRCLILLDAFFEWKWLDNQGKHKQKYKIEQNEHKSFALAGIWAERTNPITGLKQMTYSILTTEATGIMAEIHNSKKRMPLVLSENYEQIWLNEGKIIIQNKKLIASEWE